MIHAGDKLVLIRPNRSPSISVHAGQINSITVVRVGHDANGATGDAVGSSTSFLAAVVEFADRQYADQFFPLHALERFDVDGQSDRLFEKEKT